MDCPLTKSQVIGSGGHETTGHQPESRPPTIIIRPARDADIPAVADLMRRSTAALGPAFYDESCTDLAVRFITNPDLDLIRDGTYYVALSPDQPGENVQQSRDKDVTCDVRKTKSLTADVETADLEKLTPDAPDAVLARDLENGTSRDPVGNKSQVPQVVMARENINYLLGKEINSCVNGDIPCGKEFKARENEEIISAIDATDILQGSLRLIGCGGWSTRRKLFTGNAAQEALSNQLLDPRTDPAKIRAFFVDPVFARRGVASAIYRACEAAARGRGFRALELLATLPGVPFYDSQGFQRVGPLDAPLINGEMLPCMQMRKSLVDP